jgi:hypothetical protein
MRRNVESLIRLVAPVLDVVLWSGEQVSKVAGRNDLAPEPPRVRGTARTPIGGGPARGE